MYIPQILDVSLMAVTHLVTPCGLLPPDILQGTQAADAGHSHQILMPQIEIYKRVEVEFYVHKCSGVQDLMLCPMSKLIKSAARWNLH